MDNIENQKIEEYLTKLRSYKEDEFVDETKKLKNKISNKMANIICDEVNRVYNKNSFNPEKISEIISFSLEPIVKDYTKKITNDFEKKHQDNKKREREIKHEKTIFEVSNKIITDINTHIKFRESLENLNYNRGYHGAYNLNQIRKLEELEGFIRHIVKKNTNELTEKIEDVYVEILSEYNKKEQQFLTDVSKYKKEEKEIKNTSGILNADDIFEETKNNYNKTNRVIDKPLGILDPNAIFDDEDYNESENSKTFK